MVDIVSSVEVITFAESMHPRTKMAAHDDKTDQFQAEILEGDDADVSRYCEGVSASGVRYSVLAAVTSRAVYAE